MNREEYRSILGQLPIKSPTPKDMALLCPHLTEEEAVKAFTTGSGYVACPPLRVRYGFQVVSYHAEWVEKIKVWRNDTRIVTGTKNHPARLDYSFASRTPESYADGESHGDVFSDYVAMEEAMNFAEENWGEELILDTWESAARITIQDPTDLVNDTYHTDQPRTKGVLFAALSRGMYEIDNDHSKPKSLLYDEVIVELALDRMIHSELIGGRGGYSIYNCAHCGYGLSLTGCNGCGHRFQDDHFRCGESVPLSRKMVAFLQENDYEFKVDPEIAWKKEQQSWEHGRKAYAEMMRKREKINS